MPKRLREKFKYLENEKSLKSEKKKSFLIVFKGRSSRPEVFCKKGVLRNFAKFTGEHLCQSLFFNQDAGVRRYRSFPVNFANFLKARFISGHLRWVLR